MILRQSQEYLLYPHQEFLKTYCFSAASVHFPSDFNNLTSFSLVELPYPNAAFYAFFRVKGVKDSELFCKETLKQTGVGLAPGTAFGKDTNNWLRICYAKSPDLLEEAFLKLKAVLD